MEVDGWIERGEWDEMEVGKGGRKGISKFFPFPSTTQRKRTQDYVERDEKPGGVKASELFLAVGFFAPN